MIEHELVAQRAHSFLSSGSLSILKTVEIVAKSLINPKQLPDQKEKAFRVLL